MFEGISQVDLATALTLVEEFVFCKYCGEPLKECDTIYSDGTYEIGEISVIRYKNEYYHVGCLADLFKEEGK